MTSPAFENLGHTLKQLRRRRRRLFLIKQGSRLLIAAALLLLAASALSAWLEPARTGTVLLFCTLAVILGLLLWRGWWALARSRTDDRRLAHYVEDHIPDLEQRLLTSLEFTRQDLEVGRAGVSRQFIQQLWADAEEHLQQQRHEVETVTPSRTSWLSLAAATGVMALTIAVLLGSEPLLNAAARLVWPFAIEDPVAVVEVLPPIEIHVEPGNLELQRGDSLTIVARVVNAAPDAVTLRLQDDNVNWRDLPMSAETGDAVIGNAAGARYSHFIPALSEDTTYYVTFNERGEQSSTQYRISLYDLPRVERIDLVLDYPDYTGIKDGVEEDGGDVVAPVGTAVTLNVTFNKVVANATLTFDEAFDQTFDVNAGADATASAPAYENLELVMDGNTGTTDFMVTSDGVYRIEATDFAGLGSANPLDYFIRAIADQPPELALLRPGRDQDVMPLEEVVLEVDASDDYGLSEFTLNYSVVGGDEVQVDFLPEQNLRQVSGDELIYLEDLQVRPGDFVSYFLTLADNNALQGPAEVVSDIYFLQVIPTDQEFRRGRQGGGGGGGGGQGEESSALVTIQKDIIAATWKLRNRQEQVSPEEFAADAEIIAESQKEATTRARMSIERLAERLNFSDQTYDAAVENLSLAIEQMNIAAGELDLLQVTSALKPEQLALQYILRAEASINRTDISMQRGGGGGGGGGARQEREDLRDLFEMEMGELENRYETPSRAGAGSRQNQEEVNKLEELARRQEGLTRAQRNLARRQEQMTEEQKRRELERLMRQQEQLSEEVARLAQQMSRGQQGQASSSSRSPTSNDGSAAGGDSQSGTPLQQAARQMQEAADSDSASMAAARSQKALENLRRQQRELNEQGERSVSQLARNLGRRGQQLLQQQRDLQEALQERGRQQGLGQTRSEVREDAGLEELLEAQQQQQRDLQEIEEMLRAIIARAGNEDQRLLSQAQGASRALRPIEEEMRTSNRILGNGMLNLAVDIERELEPQIAELARDLLALDPAAAGTASDRVQQVARDAEALREQIEQLQRQAQAFNEAGRQAGGGAPSVRELRDGLQRSGQLAGELQQQLARQPQPGAGSPGDGRRNGLRNGLGGRVGDDGNNAAVGNARSIRQQLTELDIEDFLNQPELFRQLLEPAIQLENALRAQAELDSITTRLYATGDETIPDEYRELVQEYYRVLSENQEAADEAR